MEVNGIMEIQVFGGGYHIYIYIYNSQLYIDIDSYKYRYRQLQIQIQIAIDIDIDSYRYRYRYSRLSGYLAIRPAIQLASEHQNADAHGHQDPDAALGS